MAILLISRTLGSDLLSAYFHDARCNTNGGTVSNTALQNYTASEVNAGPAYCRRQRQRLTLLLADTLDVLYAHGPYLVCLILLAMVAVEV